MESATATLANGTLFEDRYEIQGELGSGSFSRVYQARQISTGQSVAVKLLSAREGAGREVERFRREMEICAALSHPNVVGLIDSGETATGQQYAVFEHVPGETLAEALEREGSLGAGERLQRLRHQPQRFAHAKGAFPLERLGERLTGNVLEYGVQLSGRGLPRVDQSHDVRVRERGTDLHLAA